MTYVHKKIVEEQGLFCGADFSEDRRHRYMLWRRWNLERKDMCFVMLNPSIADEFGNDDPTVVRCIRRAQMLDYGGAIVVNLFSLVSTDPSELYKASEADAIGEENDEAIEHAATVSGIVVCGWGFHGALHGRGEWVRKMLEAIDQEKVHVLDLTKARAPKHPLYIPYSQAPFRWVA